MADLRTVSMEEIQKHNTPEGHGPSFLHRVLHN